MMLGAIGCGFCGLILSVLGMKCTSIAAQRQKVKSLFALIGGLLLGVAGELNTKYVSLDVFYNVIIRSIGGKLHVCNE